MPEAIALILGSIGMDREVERAAAIEPFWASRALGMNLLRILEQQKPLLRAQWRRDEAKVCVKASRVFVQRMGEDRSNAGLFRDQQRAANRVLQHANSDAKPLVICGDGKPGQDDNMQRETPYALMQSLWRFSCVDLAHCEAEVPGDAILVVGNNKRFGRAAGLSLPGMVHQPVVQDGLAAIKAIEPVLSGQRLRRPPGHGASQGARRAKRSCSPSLACSGLSSRSIRASAWEPETMNRR